jgi:hypothetical protein
MLNQAEALVSMVKREMTSQWPLNRVVSQLLHLPDTNISILEGWKQLCTLTDTVYLALERFRLSEVISKCLKTS